jgi:hypothetical protein
MVELRQAHNDVNQLYLKYKRRYAEQDPTVFEIQVDWLMSCNMLLYLK